MEDNRGTGMAEAVLVLTFLIILMLLFREKLIGMIVWRLEHLFMKAQ